MTILTSKNRIAKRCKESVSPDDLELCSILECLLYFYQTGDTKVMSFLKKVKVDEKIDQFGFPFIGSDLVNLKKGRCFFNKWVHSNTDRRKYNSEYLLGKEFGSLVEIKKCLAQKLWINNRAAWIGGNHKQNLINSISNFIYTIILYHLADSFLYEVAKWIHSKLSKSRTLFA